MSIYKFSDFEEQLNSSGLSGQFSKADMALAQKNPDAGMAILSAKKNYMSATTAEGRALANAEAESVRKSYGGYTGGADGGSFNLEPLSPSSFQSSEAPTYTSPYTERIDAALSKVENRQPFEYNYETDPAWQSYNKQYTREGSLATEDVLGKAAAMTGGKVSTAAITAAGQTANQYGAAKADIIPTLYQQAYDRAMSEFEADREVLSDLQGAENMNYNKYLTDLNQYNTDRNFGYGQLLDEIDAQRANRNEEQALREYDDSRADVKWSQDQALREYEDSRADVKWSQDQALREYDDSRADVKWSQDQTLREYEDSRADVKWSQDQTEKNAAADLEQLLWEREQAEKEYADSRTDAAWEKGVTERELAMKENSAAVDNAYTQKQLDLLSKEGSSDDVSEKEIDTYNAIYDSQIGKLKSEGVSEELRESLMPYETWAYCKKLGYGVGAGYDSYADYVDATVPEILKEAKGGK